MVEFKTHLITDPQLREDHIRNARHLAEQVRSQAELMAAHTTFIFNDELVEIIRLLDRVVPPQQNADRAGWDCQVCGWVHDPALSHPPTPQQQAAWDLIEECEACETGYFDSEHRPDEPLWEITVGGEAVVELIACPTHLPLIGNVQDPIC